MSKMMFVMFWVFLAGCGCSSGPSKGYFVTDQAHVKGCIQDHLGKMASADHVVGWDAELYEAVALECERLFLSSVTFRFDNGRRLRE